MSPAIHSLVAFWISPRREGDVLLGLVVERGIGGTIVVEVQPGCPPNLVGRRVPVQPGQILRVL